MLFTGGELQINYKLLLEYHLTVLFIPYNIVHFLFSFCESRDIRPFVSRVNDPEILNH